MSFLRRALLRLYNVIRPARAERQLAREIHAHLALLEEDFAAQGAVAGGRARRGAQSGSAVSSRPRSSTETRDCS